MGQLRREGARWRYSETVSADTVSAPLLLPEMDEPRPATVAVHPAAGATGRIEYTLAPRADVEAGLATVKWLTWPVGDTTIPAADVIEGPATAVRCVATGGSVDWEVLA